MFLIFNNTVKNPTKIQVYILPISQILKNYQYQNNSI